MRPLMLDYRARPPVVTRLGIVWLSVGVLLMAAAAWEYGSAFDAMQRQEEQLESLNSQLKRKVREQEQRVAQAKRLDPELGTAKAVLRRLSLPWEDVFAALEQATRAYHNRIRLLGVQPDVDKGVVMLSGESTDFDGIIDYLKQIEKHGMLTRVRLINHQLQTNVPGRPIRFYAIGEWKPAS